MNHKSKIILRLNILFGVFFAMTLILFLSTIFSNNFQEGFKEGFHDGQKGTVANKILGVTMPRNANMYNIPVYANQDSTLIVTGRTGSMDFCLSGPEVNNQSALILNIMLMFLFTFCTLAILVLILLMILSLRHCVKSGNVFSRDNIKFIRAIAIVLIARSLIQNGVEYLQTSTISEILKNTSWQLAGWEFHSYDIYTGVLILIIAEIFAIGYDITEDQKLTI